jgi:3-hydroxyisobutyrate dehydrogenase-like beta-hydroxyacid dehydrogenase
MGKDLHYARADAATLGVVLLSAETAQARFSEALKAGYANKDMSAVIEPLRAQKK